MNGLKSKSKRDVMSFINTQYQTIEQNRPGLIFRLKLSDCILWKWFSDLHNEKDLGS